MAQGLGDELLMPQAAYVAPGDATQRENDEGACALHLPYMGDGYPSPSCRCTHVLQAQVEEACTCSALYGAVSQCISKRAAGERGGGEGAGGASSASTVRT